MPMSLVYFLFYYFLTFGISFTSSSGKIFLVDDVDIPFILQVNTHKILRNARKKGKKMKIESYVEFL